MESNRNGRTSGPENIEPGRGTHRTGTLSVPDHSGSVHHSIEGTTRLQTRERQNSIPKVGTRQLDPATKTDSKPQQLSLPPTVKVEAPDPIHSAHPSQNVKSQVWATIDSTAQLTPPAIQNNTTNPIAIHNPIAILVQSQNHTAIEEHAGRSI